MARYTLPSPRYIPNVETSPGIRSGVNYAKGLDMIMSFVNLSNHSIYVTTREGVTTRIPPQDQYPVDEFVINKTYRTKGVHFNVGCPADEDPKYQGYFERKTYAAQQAHDRDIGNHDQFSNAYYTKYVVAPSQLATYENKSVYLVNLDIVVSLHSPADGIIHPFTLHGESDSFIDEVNKKIKLEDSCVYSIRIVDNERRVGDQFINISGDVIKITAVKDLSRPDGVYIYNGDAFNKRAPRYYPLEDLTKSGILFYSSYELALSAGNPKTIHEERLRKAEGDHKLKLLEVQKELEEQKARLAKEQQVSKTLEEQNKRIQEELKHRREMEKNEYDRRSQKRKDSSDDLKWMAALTIAVFTAVAALAKAYSTEK